MRLKDKISLISKEKGWQIILNEGQIISEELKVKYNISEQNEFSEMNTKDRIEIAVDFVNDLLKWSNHQSLATHSKFGFFDSKVMKVLNLKFLGDIKLIENLVDE